MMLFDTTLIETFLSSISKQSTAFCLVV